MMMDIREQFEIWHLDNYISRPLFASRNMKYEWENKKNEIARAYQAGYESQQAEIIRLTAIIEEMKQIEIDAKRYRWLRNKSINCDTLPTAWCVYGESATNSHPCDDNELDEAIDEAMRKDK